eukprot:GGOE01023187.1.p2 GENE.GGOE01023187.1~~GGOE01023187.1.p2  ORF type:complete len:148 (-),score=21.82 GGOE01023187.1:297-740(-)
MTPNLQPLLQEVVNQPGWHAGGHLLLFLLPNFGRRRATMAGGRTSLILHVDSQADGSEQTSTDLPCEDEDGEPNVPVLQPAADGAGGKHWQDSGGEHDGLGEEASSEQQTESATTAMASSSSCRRGATSVVRRPQAPKEILGETGRD